MFGFCLLRDNGAGCFGFHGGNVEDTFRVFHLLGVLSFPTISVTDKPNHRSKNTKKTNYVYY